MRFAVNSRHSLRALLIVMIVAPILPAIGLAPLTLPQLWQHWHQFGAIAGLALGTIMFRVLGGIVALVAAGRLIRSMHMLARAANALADGAIPASGPSGITEIDDVLLAMNDAAQSLRRRSQEYEAAEAGRCASEERLRDFADTGSDWLWETDQNHCFTYLSDHIRVFGQDPTSRLGRARWELRADPASEPEKWRDHRATLDRHEPFRDFVYTRRVGGQPEQTISVSGKPVFAVSGEFCGYRGTARDISERVLAERNLREAKAEAEAASLAKSRFLANMSHELRTPLNAVLGFAEVLERETAGPLGARQQEYVGYIRQSGAHLLRIISEILDLAKIDAGKLELAEEVGVEVRPLAESCAAFVRERALAEQLVLRCEIEADMPALVVDSTRLKQVLLNLLSNAVKFTEPGGCVVLAVRRAAAGGVEFEVSDTGLGMTAEEIAIAAEPFGQVDSGLARRHEGAGLGLPLARRLTELHGGSFSLASEKARGTRVVIGLPATRVLERRPLADATIAASTMAPCRAAAG
ncbi:MAG TPA: ATP-binding protein [Stellaceae bacterium]|nr:ATP-binding protein [Stellaceae bacterium]